MIKLVYIYCIKSWNYSYKEYKKIYYLKNHKKCISDVIEWQRRQREHYKYILDLPDNEFLEIVRNFYRGEK